MAAAILVRGRGFHEVDELVAELDEGVARSFAAQRKVKNLAVEIESLVDIADLERDVVDADKPRFLGIGLAGLAHLRPSCWFVPNALPIYVNAGSDFPEDFKTAFRAHRRASCSQGRGTTRREKRNGLAHQAAGDV